MNRVAASLAEPDTTACLARLHELAPDVVLAEVRLDLMESWDLPRLILDAPCPLSVTCRPPREGGRFVGSEAERLDILSQAMQLGCAYVDIEWDSIAALKERRRTSTRLIASRHWTDRMPSKLWATYEALAAQVDVVKLVGMATCAADMLPVFDLLRRATNPVIGMAMGVVGQLTRLLAPCFPMCLLTYGAATATAATAP